MSWAEDQKWEAAYWGDCRNTLIEELKQLSYFKRLGLKETGMSHWRFTFDMEGKSVADVGGGPASFLLKCINVHGWVIDPNCYPEWVYKRYDAAGIRYMHQRGEAWVQQGSLFDEVWMYNVLQHVDDPELVMRNARRNGKLLRFFDWLDTPPHEGHPNTLTKELLDGWLGASGTTEIIDENDARGFCYYGVFPQ